MMENFAKRFNKALEMKEVSCAELSRRTGINEATLSNYRKGKYEPKQINLSNIAKALNVDIAWLMGADVEPDEKKTKKQALIDLIQGLSEQETDALYDLLSARLGKK